MNITRFKYHALVLVTLMIASAVSTAMVLGRAYYSGQLQYRFLVWNLFLAWLPLLFAWLAYRRRQRHMPVLVFGGLWLLFFPNAPYLVTDLMHLRWSSMVPAWYDAIMIFSFALTGLLLGLLSLLLMQTIVSRRSGAALSWLFVVAAVSLSSFGVYIGRFLRWNSWDVFSHPLTLTRDIAYSLLHPQMMLKTYTVSLLLTAVSLFAYLILFSLPRLVLEAQSES